MRLRQLRIPGRDGPVWTALVLAISVLIAVLSARPYAGGWNDGSRLATVECLVDYHTLAIDQSIFVQVQPRDGSATNSPYPPDEPNLLLYGTGDKLLVGKHFYSDKSPVPGILMAGLYEIWEAWTGATARQRPDSFCYWMTLGSSGLAYVVAVYCIYQLGGVLRLKLPLRLWLTGSFAWATVALAYVRQVNNHILLLGVAAALFLELAQIAEDLSTGRGIRIRLAGLGFLAGLGYTIDLGAGPVLLVGTLAAAACRCPRPRLLGLFLLTALPWLVLHHVLNFMVGGTFKPANAVPEYFDWPGCTFNAQNLTGSWNHAGLVDFLLYAADLLFGKRGFLGHNLTLYLALWVWPILLRREWLAFAAADHEKTTAHAWSAAKAWHPSAVWPELLLAAGWCGGTWLLYALTSNNSSGQCCSIRWFVPFLAAGYYVLALCLREEERSHVPFLILSGWGSVMAALMWRQGPWMKHMVPFYWPLQGAALLSLVIPLTARRAGLRQRPETAPLAASRLGALTQPRSPGG